MLQGVMGFWALSNERQVSSPGDLRLLEWWKWVWKGRLAPIAGAIRDALDLLAKTLSATTE